MMSSDAAHQGARPSHLRHVLVRNQATGRNRHHIQTDATCHQATTPGRHRQGNFLTPPLPPPPNVHAHTVPLRYILKETASIHLV